MWAGERLYSSPEDAVLTPCFSALLFLCVGNSQKQPKGMASAKTLSIPLIIDSKIPGRRHFAWWKGKVSWIGQATLFWLPTFCFSSINERGCCALGRQQIMAAAAQRALQRWAAQPASRVGVWGHGGMLAACGVWLPFPEFPVQPLRAAALKFSPGVGWGTTELQGLTLGTAQEGRRGSGRAEGHGAGLVVRRTGPWEEECSLTVSFVPCSVPTTSIERQWSWPSTTPTSV